MLIYRYKLCDAFCEKNLDIYSVLIRWGRYAIGFSDKEDDSNSYRQSHWPLLTMKMIPWGPSKTPNLNSHSTL